MQNNKEVKLKKLSDDLSDDIDNLDEKYTALENLKSKTYAESHDLLAISLKILILNIALIMLRWYLKIFNYFKNRS